MKQQPNETARSFVARRRGVAQTCPFQIKCGATGCNHVNSYTDSIVRWVLLNGLISTDITRETLGTDKIDTKTLEETLAVIEAKERASRACEIDAASKVSTYKHHKKSQETDQRDHKKQAGSQEMTSCTGCSKPTPKYGRNRYGRSTEFKYCSDCF